MKLKSDHIQYEKFAHTMVTNLSKYGFGVLSKTDFEALTLYALIESSSELATADSFLRAELLRITDQKYRTLSRRIGMWLQTQNYNDEEYYNKFLLQCIMMYVESSDVTEIRVVIDDEMERRNIQRSIERISGSLGPSMGPDLSLNGRQLVLRGTDLDILIKRAISAGVIEEKVITHLKDKKGIDRRKAFLELVKQGIIELSKIVATITTTS